MAELITEGRKLCTIRKITEINPIPNADAIDVAMVDGWQVVVKKGEFRVGDYCVFFEIDSFLPAQDGRFAFLLRNGTKVDENGVERIRLRSVKLKQTLSQGLVLPIKLFDKDILNITEYRDVIDGCLDDDIMSYISETLIQLEESRNGIEQYLNVTKYERPDERNGGAGKAKVAGDFPYWVKKTDAERLQNLYNNYKDKFVDVEFRPSLKMDGSSTTISFVSDECYFNNKLDDVFKSFNEETQTVEVIETVPYPFKDESGQLIVCSRNLTLKYDPTVGFWKAVHNTQIHKKLKSYCIEYNRQLSIQLELTGPGVNGNWDNFEDYDFHAFHIWDIDKQEYVDDLEFQELCSIMKIQTVKQFDIIKPFTMYSTFGDFLKASDIPSINNPIAEGICYKSTKKIDGQQILFKVINNKYLLSEK